MKVMGLGVGLSALLMMGNVSLHASDIMQHHWHLTKVAVAVQHPMTSQQLRSKSPFWISFLESRNQRGVILDQADKPVIRIPAIVRSPYDASYTQDMRSLYESTHPRIAIIANFAVNLPHRGVMSIGLDTGHQSTKLKIDPSLYLGWASTLKSWSNANLSFSVGAWIGGGTTERACFDDYSRAFQCHTLLPWTDRVGLQGSQEMELSGAIRFQRHF